MWQRIYRFLDAPYPVETSFKRVVVGAVCVSVFVSLFLALFQPFQLSTIEGPYRLLLIASFGLPCFPIMIVQGGLFIWISSKWNFETYWKVSHEMLANLLIPLLIGVSNYFHAQLLFHWPFVWQDLSRMLLHTEAVAFFPIVGMVAWDWDKLMRKHRGVADNLNEEQRMGEPRELPPAHDRGPQVCLVGENQQEQLVVYLDQLLYVTAAGNYVELAIYSKKEGKLQLTLLRAPLKSVESQLSDWSERVRRCHRSYLVNCDKIIKAEGNAQGLVLSLIDSEHRVPVSRKYVEVFRSRKLVG